MSRAVTVPFRSVFKADDPDAAVVLQIAAVADDLDSTARLLSERRETADSKARKLYALRMTAMHVFELSKFVNCGDLIRVSVRCARHKGCEELPALLAALKDRINKTALNDILARLRNGFAGHYLQDGFREALLLLTDTTTFVVPEHGARHGVVDELALRVLLADANEDPRYRSDDETEVLGRVVDAIVSAHAALVPFVQALVVGMYLETRVQTE